VPYLECPRCRATFHTGAIYERLEVCPRCGARLDLPEPSLRERLRRALRRRPPGESPDWETITGSQYTVRDVRRPDRDQNGNAPTPT
jgi:hypothetical protein